MTSQKDIQSLIADIDSILPKVNARLPWSKPGDVAKERRVLERVRSYLVAQQQNFVAASEQQSAPTVVAQQIAQAVTQEINIVHADLLQVLQTDLEALRTERESLVREIRHLEDTRQQLASLPQQKIVQQQVISEFSEELLDRFTERLTQQMAQILANESANQGFTPVSAHWGNLDSVKQAQDRLDQLRQVQLQSDRMLSTLDANQRTIFEALQRNLHSYQESLSQGLEKMHQLGVQGEMLFTALVNRLAQQLGREASTHFAASGQLADSLSQSDRTTTYQTTPETLLPTNALSLTQRSFYTNVDTADITNPAFNLQPNRLSGELLHPLSPVESFLPEQVGKMSSPQTPASMGNMAAIPLTPPNVNVPEELDVATPEPSDEHSILENLHSEDWEIIEGLEFAVLDVQADINDEIDTFIQLDLAAEQTFNVDNRSQEIDELYQSLFGSDTLSDSAKLNESESSTAQFPTAFFGDLQVENSPLPTPHFPLSSNDQISNKDLVNPLFPNLENALFEGLADPASELPPTQPFEGLAEQPAESWEVLFLDESIPESSTAGEWLGEVEALLEGLSEQENIRTIEALTDLFEEMGLSDSSPISEDNSIPVITNLPRDDRGSAPYVQSSPGEENYIPASPEENLLTTEGLERISGRDFSLDQNTLQQFQQDLHSFEELENQTFPISQEQRSLENYGEPPTIASDAALVNPQNQWFPMWEELLAEDWEEVIHNDSYTQQPDRADASKHLEPESVDSDFEPELFPSEALELDQENALNLINATTSELVNSGDPTAVEDEIVVDEIQWDDATDSSTEERISSPELEIDLHDSSDSTIEPQPGESLTPDRQTVSETVQDELIDDSHSTRFSPQVFDSDLASNASEQSEQQTNELSP